MRRWKAWAGPLSTISAIITIVQFVPEIAGFVERVGSAILDSSTSPPQAILDGIAIVLIAAAAIAPFAFERRRHRGIQGAVAGGAGFIGSVLLAILLLAITQADLSRAPSPRPPIPRPEPPNRLTTEAGSCREALARSVLGSAPPEVAEAMMNEWRTVGASEIGCPVSSPARRGGVFVLELGGGESDPSLITSDRYGRSAVVFEPQAREALRLWRTGALAHADPRGSFGEGDYQLFHLRDGSCVFSWRPTYGARPVTFPPSATTVLLREVRRLGAFPYVAGSTRDNDQTLIWLVFDRDLEAQPTTVVVNSAGTAWVKGDTSAPVRRSDAGCPSSHFYDVAGTVDPVGAG